VIELKRDAVPDVVINQLYKHTALQESFGVNMLAIVDGRPKLLNLREALRANTPALIEVMTELEFISPTATLSDVTAGRPGR